MRKRNLRVEVSLFFSFHQNNLNSCSMDTKLRLESKKKIVNKTGIRLDARHK